MAQMSDTCRPQRTRDESTDGVVVLPDKSLSIQSMLRGTLDEHSNLSICTACRILALGEHKGRIKGTKKNPKKETTCLRLSRR